MSSIVEGTKSFKPFEGHFGDTVGMNRYFAVQGIKEGVEGLTSAYDAVESFYNQDYRGFSHIGHGFGSIGSAALNVGGAVGFALGMRANRSGSWGPKSLGFGKRTVLNDVAYTVKPHMMENLPPAMKRQAGEGYWLKDSADGTLRHSSSPKTIIAKEEAEVMMRKMEKQTLFSGSSKTHDLMKKHGAMSTTEVLEGGFQLGNKANLPTRIMRGLGGWKGNLAIIGAQIIGGMAISAVTSAAGNLMDQAHMEYQSGKYAHYDTRDFNNKAMQNWGMNASQAMGQYEMNNMSIARSYHSRG